MDLDAAADGVGLNQIDRLREVQQGNGGGPAIRVGYACRIVGQAADEVRVDQGDDAGGGIENAPVDDRDVAADGVGLNEVRGLSDVANEMVAAAPLALDAGAKLLARLPTGRLLISAKMPIKVGNDVAGVVLADFVRDDVGLSEL